MREFKDVLRQLRQNAGMTQSELGKKLGIAKTTVSSYELGTREPSFEMEEAIADLFNVDLIYTAESPVALVTAGFSLRLVYCASIIRIYSDKFQAIKKSSRHIAKSSSRSNLTFNVAQYYYTPVEARELLKIVFKHLWSDSSYKIVRYAKDYCLDILFNDLIELSRYYDRRYHRPLIH